MLKMKKRIFAGFISAVMLASAVNAFAAQISWDESDYTDVTTVYANNFDSAASSDFGGTLDTATFAGDENHKNVVFSESNMGGRPGTLVDCIKARNKIKFKFDYYSAEGDTLRVELRSIASKGNNEIFADNAAYWTGDATKKIIEKSKWNTFEGTFDVDGYLKSIEGEGVSVLTGSPYLFIKATNGKLLYIDNVEITIAPELLPFMSPSVTYDSGLTKVDDVDGHTDVYKKTVTSAGEFNYLSGSALRYFKDGETYECSFSFKQESTDNTLKTHLLRFRDVNSSVVNTWNNGGNWWINNGNAGEWITVTNRITLNSADAKEKPLLDDGKFLFTLSTSGLAANTEYTYYIADFKFRRVPEVSANSVTSAYDESQNVSLGSSLSVAVDGYFNSSKAPRLSINGAAETGKWENVTTDDRKSTGTAVFENVTTTNYPGKQYNAALTLTNIWGSEETGNVTVNFVKAQSQTVEILSGDWETLYTTNDVTGLKSTTEWLSDKVQFTDVMNSGKALIRFSFTVKGVKDADYAALDGKAVSIRMGSVVDAFVNLSKVDLADGEEHTYSVIADMGAFDRYVKDGSDIVDRTTYKYSVLLRGDSANPLNYSNIKVEYFNPDSANKTYNVARVKVTNNSADRFAPEGVIVFAEYANANQLTKVNFKKVKYIDDGELLNALGKDESKYVYCVFTDSDNLAAADAGRSYRAFWWESLDTMIPLTEFAEQ